MGVMPKLSKYLSLAANPHKAMADKRYLFVVSHMRSRTTLLSHILGSNPEICGHTEQGISYANRKGYWGLKQRLFSDPRYDRATYLLDKVLHNGLDFNAELVSRYNPRFILISRRPDPTIRSIKRMFDKTGNRYTDESVHTYYVSRIEYLVNFARHSSGEYFYIDSDDFVASPDPVLSALSEYLHLQNPLSSNYEIFSDTGEAVKGDPGENIRAGTVLVQTSPETESDEDAAYADLYRAARKTFLDHCVNN